ncbi:TOG array regulator of axonemal microtubules protein 1-like [Corythoichthys intestinalis]|uniref:TOG array regulator of axonemal microtubules protein 1-like n=1 Tax=Corythoichthys intestinalis TaxID=161448 RepID=UPI0025A62C95|nr:TOG array regulator of axonemal microtubules protein 1-like [Corythoichthys intestinalis]XP_057715384.1 TOG array regulator of axonemal microtubules protein 1-like [Corythoichthys intestinalis]XP_057715385.1 TOG array regulator of axonemal microtubules protein 1-like [Corythoichthys intestinalis]
MIVGIVSQELYQQLLDPKNYQNRTNGVEELKRILSEVDLKLVPSESIEEFINFLTRLLDDSNFKVLYGTLQVLNLLIERLDASILKYKKQIALVGVKALGDTRTIARNEYMNMFRLMMKTVAPQEVLDLIICNLKHKNSRVREDVLSIIIAAMLTHPRKEFNIPKLCFEVAPYLADSKRKVRHAALELFAVFDSCLDMGKKQPLTKAVDMVELSEDAEGLMAAVQARRARHVLPRLSEEGVVEYGLVVAKSGVHCSTQGSSSGADLDWVMNGGRISSARSQRTEQDCERLYGYGSLGSLTDGLRSQRRIVSAGKGKNKLPWETLSNSSNEKNHQCRSPDGTCSEQATSEEITSPSRKFSPETYIPTFSSAEPQTPQTSRRRIAPARIRRSGSLNLDPDIFKTTNFTESDSVLSKGQLLSRNPSVERTLSLPTNHTTTSSFLLPSYPLAALPGGMLTPTLSRRHADSSLSMSNTWPNKRENSPHQRDTSPWGDTALKGDLSSRHSPRPIRASLKSSSSTSSFRRALNSSRTAVSISPVVPSGEQFYSTDQSPNVCNSPQNQHQERDVQLEPAFSKTTQDPQEEDALDMQEMLNSLRSLRNSAAKKRAKLSLSGSDPDQELPDSSVRSSLGQDLPLHTSPILTSSTGESSLSNLSPTPSSVFGKSSGSMASPRVKSRIARVSYANLRSSVSMDVSNPPGLSQSNELSSEVGVVGQRVTYSNGKFRAGEDATVSSPPLVKPLFRVVKATKGSGSSGSRNSPTTDMPEGVIGRGMFGTAVSSLRSDLTWSLEKGDFVDKPTVDLLGGLPVISGDHKGRDDPSLDEVNNTKSIREKIELQHSDELDGQSTQREKIRYRVRQMLSDSPKEENMDKNLHLNGSTITSCIEDFNSEGSPISLSSSVSPPGLQSPVKCLTPPHQPSPPTVPPNPQNLSRMRRAPSLNRTRPSLSHSSDDLSPDTMSHKKNVSQPPGLSPFSKPDVALMQSFDLLNTTDWDKKIEGLTLLRSLAHFHSDTLQSRIRDVCLSLIEEVKNLRSGVSRAAVCTLADLYTHLEKAMDQELDATVKSLLVKAGGKDVFIRHDIDAALDSMVQHCTPTRGIHALLSGGLCHPSGLVRNCTAQHLANLIEKVGATRLLSGGKDLTERIIPAVTKLSQDSSQEARYYGRRMLLLLSGHPDFEKILERIIPFKYLQTTRDTILTLKTKGLGEMPQETQSARGRRSLPGSGTFRALSLTREPLNHTVRMSNSNYSNRSQALNIEDKSEYIKHITGLLGSKDFRERIKGMDQLVADCEHNPKVVIQNVFPIFDALQARLQESNTKVNQYALESLQKIIPLFKDNLSQVVNILVPAIVDNHLNSRNNAIYSAATRTINALILNLDNSLLLQPFCTKAQFVSGKAKVDLVEKVADMVNELYPRKPQLVEQKALPLLWHLLGASSHSGTVHGRGGSVRGATACLCRTLSSHMGPGLNDYAAAQSVSIHKGLNEVLKNTPKR